MLCSFIIHLNFSKAQGDECLCEKFNGEIDAKRHSLGYITLLCFRAVARYCAPSLSISFTPISKVVSVCVKK
jgi:hypothetical protein